MTTLRALAASLLAAGLTACSAALPTPAEIRSASPPALAEMTAALQPTREAAPTDPHVLYLLGMALLRQGRVEPAEQVVLRALRRAPFQAPLLELLGEVYLAQGKFFRAVTTFGDAVRFQPQLLSAYVHLGATQLKLGQSEEAEKTLQAALRKEPLFFDAHLLLSRVRFAQGKTAEAAQAVAEARRIRPLHREAVVLEIRIATDLGRMAYARHLIANAQRTWPQDPELDYALLEIHRQREEWSEAAAVLEKLARQGPLNSRGLVIRAEMLTAQNQVAAALELLEKLTAAEPAYAPALLARARLLLARNEALPALALSNKAVELLPRGAEGFYWKAHALFQLERDSQGEAALAVAERLDPHHGGIRLLRIQRLMAGRALQPARNALTTYLSDFPADRFGLLVHHELLALEGRVDEAERLLKEIGAGAHAAGWMSFARARLAYLRGEHEAVVRLTQPLGSAPSVPWRVVYLRAAALGRLGRLDEALALSPLRLQEKAARGAFHLLTGNLLQQAGHLARAQATFSAGLALWPRDVRLLEGAARVAIQAGNLPAARALLEAGVELDSPFRGLFLDRLAMVLRELKKPAAAATVLGRYLHEVDPLLSEPQRSAERAVLFGPTLLPLGLPRRLPQGMTPAAP